MKCKPSKENILLAPVKVILGADSGAKHVGDRAAPGFADSGDPGCTGLGLGKLMESEAGPSESS